MDNPLVRASKTYEVVINSTAVGKFPLPDDSILRGKTIVGVAIRNQSEVLGITRESPSGRDLVSNSALAACFVSLFQDNKAIINECPAEFFVPDLRQGNFVPVYIESFSPSTSFIRFTDNARLTLNQAVEMTFYYEPQ